MAAQARQAKPIAYPATARPIAPAFMLAVRPEHRPPLLDALRRGVKCRAWPGCKAADAETRFAVDDGRIPEIRDLPAYFAALDYRRYRLVLALREADGRSITPQWLARCGGLAFAAGTLRNRIVEANMPLATNIVRRLRWAPEDAGQVAALALIRAVDNFDAQRGYQFSTYAHRAVIVDIWKLRNGTDEAEPTTACIERFGRSDPHGERSVDAGVVAEYVEQLPHGEQVAVKMRFLQPTSAKLHEIGNVLGVTKERARQLIEQGLDRLRLWLGVESETDIQLFEETKWRTSSK